MTKHVQVRATGETGTVIAESRDTREVKVRIQGGPEDWYTAAEVVSIEPDRGFLSRLFRA